MPLFKIKGKPQLYSFGLENEFNYIEKKVYDGRRYSKRDLLSEEEIYKTLARDFLEIIETKKIQEYHIENLRKSIMEGPAGVWETATSNLEKLAYYFPEAKEEVKRLIQTTKSRIAVRAITMLSEAFSDDDIMEILLVMLNHRSKEVRCKIACCSTHMGNLHLVPGIIALLKKRIEIERDPKVIESLSYSIRELSKNQI